MQFPNTPPPIVFLSTLSLRRATGFYADMMALTAISIHALLAESDLMEHLDCKHTKGFLSTLSLRRATVRGSQARAPNGDFYPRSPCGERPPRLSRVVPTPIFLSTLSLRRATVHELGRQAGILISIHALLAESDPYMAAMYMCTTPNFYPRSPCGERQRWSRGRRYPANFYPRSPCGERHVMNTGVGYTDIFLSTLSLRRATRQGVYRGRCPRNFYPRSPCGERP